MANRSAIDIYPTLVRAFKLVPAAERPDFLRVRRTTGIDLRTIKRAWDVGYPATHRHERFPAIRVLFEKAAGGADLAGAYLNQLATEPEPKPAAPTAEEVRAQASVSSLIEETLAGPKGPEPATAPPAEPEAAPGPRVKRTSEPVGLAALLAAPPAPPAHKSMEPAPAPPKPVVVYVGSDAAERKAVDAARHGAAGLASIAIQILAGAEPYAKAVRARMEQAASSATVEDSKFVLTTLDDLSKILERSANAIAKLSAVTSVLDGRAHEITRHESVQAPAPATPAEIAATAKAVLAEVRLWQQEREAETREGAIDVTPTERTPNQAQIEGDSDATA